MKVCKVNAEDWDVIILTGMCFQVCTECGSLQLVPRKTVKVGRRMLCAECRQNMARVRKEQK